jgi:GPH family glycoside/pentoside/hexuronide:cation symporter
MFATYFGKADLSGIASAIGFIPMMFFMPFINKIVAKYGKKEAATIGTIGSLAGGLLMFVFPMIPNKTLSLVAYIVALAIFGLGMGFYTCVSWAMMADAIEYNEYKTGRRDEGTVYSLHSFFRKLAQGVGPSMVLLIMGWLGYQSELGTVGQAPTTAMNMCWLVASLYLFSAILMFVGIALIYNIDKPMLEKMKVELDARRATTVEAVEPAIVEE